jgi:hypothetical protein
VEVVGSNPAAPTSYFNNLAKNLGTNAKNSMGTRTLSLNCHLLRCPVEQYLDAFSW